MQWLRGPSVAHAVALSAPAPDSCGVGVAVTRHAHGPGWLPLRHLAAPYHQCRWECGQADSQAEGPVGQAWIATLLGLELCESLCRPCGPPPKVRELPADTCLLPRSPCPAAC